MKAILNDLVGDGIYHATAEGAGKPAIKAGAQDIVTNHIAERGLVVPLRSSIVRRYLLYGEIAWIGDYGKFRGSEVRKQKTDERGARLSLI